MVPPMIIKINAGCPELVHIFGKNSLLCPLQEFMNKVKQNCTSWQDPNQLSNHLNNELLKKLDNEKKYFSSQY